MGSDETFEARLKLVRVGGLGLGNCWFRLLASDFFLIRFAHPNGPPLIKQAFKALCALCLPTNLLLNLNVMLL